MVTTRRSPAARPTSLAQAQELADRLWPGQDAALPAWLAYHEGRAKLFADAADADAGHQHEARYLAVVEREEAGEISRLLRNGSSAPPTSSPGAPVADEGA